MPNKAIQNKEGKLGLQRCFERALVQNNEVFALQEGGTCFTSATADATYDKYGPSDRCQDDGRGGNQASEVYKIVKGKYRMKMPN